MYRKLGTINPKTGVWLSAMCHQESFTNVSFMAINIVVLNDRHGFLPIFWAKKARSGE
jgi:hypothetical protein